ncbi:MAG: hypothetical protein OXU20_11985 [Myxococcales bacterium]|nr:hypothetical protein [Myxococcales bacterium]
MAGLAFSTSGHAQDPETTDRQAADAPAAEPPDPGTEATPLGTSETTQATQPAQPAQAPTVTGADVPAPTTHGRLGESAEREYLEGKNTPPPEDYDLSRIPDEYPERRGFTLEIGLGLAFSHVSGDLFDSALHLGLAPLSLSLGGFVTPELAIMLRMAGTSWFEDILGDSVLITNTFYGGAMQFWISRAAFLGAGIGIGVLNDSLIFSSPIDIRAETGLILTGRAGWAFYTSGYHALALVGEIFPAFYGDATVLGFALNLQWQLL